MCFIILSRLTNHVSSIAVQNRIIPLWSGLFRKNVDRILFVCLAVVFFRGHREVRMGFLFLVVLSKEFRRVFRLLFFATFLKLFLVNLFSLWTEVVFFTSINIDLVLVHSYRIWLAL